jgi:hypothetical protein
MSSEDKLEVQLDLITSGANKALEGLKGSFNNTFKGLNVDLGKTTQGIGGMVSSFFSLKNAAIAAGASVITYFASKEVLSKAIEEENVLNSVAIAMGRTGDYSKAALADMEAFAQGIQESSTYSAGEVLNQVNLAQAYGATSEQAKVITRASIELAAATGKSLNEASEQVSRTLSGQAGALAKLSPRIKALTEEQLKNGEAARILIEQYGGTAIGKINTFGGALQQSKNVFDDLLTQVGYLITKNPVVVEGIKAMTTVFANLAKYLEQNRQKIIDFVNDGLVAILESAPAIGDFLKFMVSALTIVTKSLSLATAGVGLIIQALLQFGPIKFLFDGLVATITLVVGGILDLLGVLAQLPGVSDTLEAMGFNVEELSNSLSGAADSSYKLFDTFKADAITEVIEKSNEFAFSIADGATEVKENLNKAIDAGVVKATKLAEVVKGIGNKGQIELTVKNNIESSQKSIDSYEQLLETAFGGAKGAKIADTMIMGLVNGLKNGKEGARAFLSSAAGAAADAFLPGIGKVVGPLVDVLSQGPDAVKKMVKEFTGALPDLIENIITAIPTLIEAFAEEIPKVIERLAEKSDEIIIALVKAMPKVAIALALESPRIMIALAKEMPKAALALVGELVRGAGRFIQEILRGAGSFVQALIDAITGKGSLFGSGGGVSGFFENANDWAGDTFGVKFATGGKVPKGFPNDSMPAKLSSDELVIDRSTTGKLEKFLDGGGGSDGVTVALLTRVVSLLEAPQTIESSFRLNQSEFAKAILQVNRTQQRTS